MRRTTCSQTSSRVREGDLAPQRPLRAEHQRKDLAGREGAGVLEGQAVGQVADAGTVLGGHRILLVDVHEGADAGLSANGARSRARPDGTFVMPGWVLPPCPSPAPTPRVELGPCATSATADEEDLR